MDLVDVRLHHLVLLLDDGAGRKSCALVALLPGLPDAFEGCILGTHVVLQGIHLLGSASDHVSHLELGMGKLLALAVLAWLPLGVYLEALVLVILWLARGPVW